MAKGQIAAVIIVLIVIGAVVYFALPTLRNLPSFGGIGGGGGTIQINNNIITIESYSVSTLKMFPKEPTIVSFLVQNNGDHEVNPTVNFYDYGGMNFQSLSCDYTSSSDNTCQFKLSPFASGKVTLTLQAPDVGSLTTFKISYSIKYSYSGSRVAIIPVIDGITRTIPLGKFTQSSSAYNPDPTKIPSYGPLQLSYSFPSSGTTIQNNQMITQSWGVNKQSFRLELEFRHIGTVDGVQPVKLTDISLTTSQNLQPSSSEANTFCPLTSSVITTLNNNNQNNILSKPLTLNCEFTPTIDSPESSAQVSTTFTYDYTIIRSETFTVQPYTQKS